MHPNDPIDFVNLTITFVLKQPGNQSEEKILQNIPEARIYFKNEEKIKEEQFPKVKNNAVDANMIDEIGELDPDFNDDEDY